MLQPAITRILIDLIKADSVIDTDEIGKFASIKKKYNISEKHLHEASDITLAQAVVTLKSSVHLDKDDFLKNIESLSKADGFSVKKETLLQTALHYCLSKNTKGRSEIISINASDISIAEDQVVFVKADDDSRCKDVEINLHNLCTEFKCSGLNFFYIPKIAEHYKSTDSSIFRDVCRFLAPGFSDSELEEMMTKIKNMTTKQFCNDYLFGKLRMSSLYNTAPAFLVHVGTSFVSNKLYNNFLKVSFDASKSYTAQLLDFLNLYTKYLSYDVVVIPKPDEDSGHFLYSGFYKYIFDLYLHKAPTNSYIAIDLSRGEIYLPSVSENFKLDKVYCKDKSLYVMILLEMWNRGVNFAISNKSDMKKLNDRFSYIYRKMGGVKDVPDMLNASNRNPSISHINSFLDKQSDKLKNTDLYKIKMQNGKYIIPFTGDIYVSHGKPGDLSQCEPLGSSTLFKEYHNIK